MSSLNGKISNYGTLQASIDKQKDLKASMTTVGNLSATVSKPPVMTAYTVDTKLSSESTNPVQNKVITQVLLALQENAFTEEDKQIIISDIIEIFKSSLKTAKIGEVTLSASAWVSAGDSLYNQIVDVEDVTNKSQVDLTPNDEQLVIFYEKDLTFVTKNEGGVVTVIAIGQKPANDYTVQVTLTEVDVPDGTTIWGITVGTPINPDLLGTVTVDDTLSDTSTNPIQNKVVAEEFDKRINIAKNTAIDKLFT